MSMRHIELFSGLGGFRVAMQIVSAGLPIAFECKAFSEIEKTAVTAYKTNFDTSAEIEMGDIVAFTEDSDRLCGLPRVDLLTGGFPCQSFSMMGGKKGFEDPRGTLFFNILSVIRQTEPLYILLENVKNLKTHDFNSSDFSLAQTRNRVYMFATRQTPPKEFEFTASAIKANFERTCSRFLFLSHQKSTREILEKEVHPKYFLSDKLKQTILSNGSGGFVSKSVIDLHIARPLCATMHKLHRACQDNYFSQGFIQGDYDGPTVGYDGLAMKVRRLTPREAFLLQGFPLSYFQNLERIGLSDSALYKLAGNAISVNVVVAILSYLAGVFDWR